VYESVKLPVKKGDIRATLPSGATHAIRRSRPGGSLGGAPVTFAQAVPPRFQVFPGCGLVQSAAKVVMLSANAVTEPPPANLFGTEGNRSIAARRALRAMLAVSALGLRRLFEVALAFEDFEDEKSEFIILRRKVWICELSWHLIDSSSLASSFKPILLLSTSFSTADNGAQSRLG